MKMKQIISKLFFPIIGIGALVWFLIRVIPKPSRATYPCMRVAYPMASGFVVYLLGLAISAFAIGKVKENWKNSRYWVMAGFFALTFFAGFITFQADKPVAYANNNSNVANSPVGIAKGIIPGRVVWVHNASAVVQSCNIDTWYLKTNVNQTKVDQMLSDSVKCFISID